MKANQKFYCFFKRIIDIFLSLFFIVLLSPAFVIISICVKFSSKGSIFFKQKRVGKSNRIFTILKFRTMTNDAPHDTPTHLLNDSMSHITKIGRLLRKSSLDELPQLFNILIGQMSFVGPRPALWNQYDLIKLRNDNGSSFLKPGLTGWAQINGRDENSIQNKADLDGFYFNNFSFFFDLKIFFMTFVKVIKSEGEVEGAQK